MQNSLINTMQAKGERFNVISYTVISFRATWNYVLRSRCDTVKN